MGFLGVVVLPGEPVRGGRADLIEDLPNIVERIRASDIFQQIDQRTDLGDKLQERA